MNDEIRVYVVDRGRKNLYMRYKDPLSGQQVSHSTGTRNKKEAERIAAKWEADVQEGRFQTPSKVTWEEFRQRYEDEVVPSLAEATAGKVSATFNAVEQYVNPDRLSKLTAERISYLQRRLREDRHVTETTIKSYMAHLKAALNWAHRIGMLVRVPNIVMPHRAKTSHVMKGRPITGEEFERMLVKTEEALFPKLRNKHCPKLPPPEVRAATAESWRYLLRGLWWSGLRLGESLELHWDRDDCSCVDLSQRFPMLRIPAELEKGHKDRLIAMAPEFAEMLLATPERERTGAVFNPRPVRPQQTTRVTLQQAIRHISAIGEAANVKVRDAGKRRKVKYASAHDLRRSFGARWATRITAQVLKELMRHESIETTLKYYVGQNAQTTAEVLWQAISAKTSMSTDTRQAIVGNILGATLGATSQNPASNSANKKAGNPELT